MLCASVSLGQELPPVVNYTPSTYGAENQNWMISQSSENYIYVANNKGLLEFNGARWTLYPSPNETIFRSVNAIGDRIYTGCYMDFGFWNHNEMGMLQYTSLSPKLSEPMLEDEQIWNIIDYDPWVLFQSLNRIYLYNTADESFSYISSDNTITKLFKTNGSFYFHVDGEGIYTIENRSKILISDDPVAKENVVVNIFERNGSFMVLTATKGFFELQDGSLNKVSIPADALLNTVSIYNTILSTNDFDATSIVASPNPADTQWNIRSAEPVTKIAVYDILGKAVMTLTPNQTDVPVDISRLQSGMYMAQVSTQQGTKTIKLLKR